MQRERRPTWKTSLRQKADGTCVRPLLSNTYRAAKKAKVLWLLLHKTNR